MPANLNLEVTTLSDVVNRADDATNLSLREAIIDCNANVPTTYHTITFSASSGTITLDPGPGENKGQLEIKEAVIIDGPASRITIQRDSSSSVKHRVLLVQAGADLRDLNLRYGSLDTGGGGGVFVNNTTLLLSRCDVNNNTAPDGGGIQVTGSNGSVTTFDCDIYSNTASSLGGGIYAGSNTNVNLNSTKVRSNTASGNGGGLYLLGNATLDGSEVYSNTASSLGGGIFASPGASGTLRLQNATSIHDNQLNNSNPALRKGGGIYFSTGTIYFGGEGDTIAIYDNSATTGDGMYRAYGTTVGYNNVQYTNDSQYDEPPP